MDAVNTEEPVFALFEGVCPNHTDTSVEVVGAEGTAEFLETYCSGYRARGAAIFEWVNKLPGDCADGELTFKCQHGCTFVVGHNVYGDWNL